MQKKSRDIVRIYYPKYDRERLISYLKSKVDRLKKAVDLKFMVLFGSYAKNRCTAASDVDLLVVHGKDYDAYKIVWDIIGITNLQLFIYSVDDYRKLKERSGFIDTVLKEGISIYKSSDFEE